MPHSKEEREAITTRRMLVAGLMTAKATVPEIVSIVAKRYRIDVSHDTITRDRRYILGLWEKDAAADIARIKAVELAELDQMERDCAIEFAKNRDSVWIVRRLQVKERRAKLLGLDTRTSDHQRIRIEMDRIKEDTVRLFLDAGLSEAEALAELNDILGKGKWRP